MNVAYLGQWKGRSSAIYGIDYWYAVLLSYVVYAVGIIANQPTTRQAGAFVVFYVLVITSLKRKIRINIDRYSYLTISLLAVLLISTLINIELFSVESAIKRLTICFFLILSSFYQLRPIVDSKCRHFFPFLILGMIIFGVITSGAGQERIKGAFVNTNVLAFVAILPFMFINVDKDGHYAWLVHVSVVVFLLYTSSLSAILGYAMGCIYWSVSKYTYRDIVKAISILIALVTISALVTIYVPFLYDKCVYIHDRVSKQSIVLNNGVRYALREGDFEHSRFANLGLSHETSAVWRIGYWSMLTKKMMKADTLHVLFGEGPDSVDIVHGNQPHNEFVRILYEHGLIGFAFVIMLGAKVFRAIPNKYRYAYVMFIPMALLSNPIDNVFGMSLIIFCGFSMISNR